MKRATPWLIVGDVLLRAFLLFGLVGLPAFLLEWLGWWSPEGWPRNAMAVWIFFYGAGFVLILFIAFLGSVVVPIVILDLWFSLSLACLGSRTAMQHYRNTCQKVGDMFAAIMKSLGNISFPLEDVENRAKNVEVIEEAE